ncbi:S-adenosyl-L-methionine-dependent methyltransferase [Ascodesmis nigricans]|uniref:rRNA adenine N(6)-methyltransferase n=1 Tax=Ascodesmis nigricans TaxID=341454 RepID=A0A4S2N4V0_9PEZI|nr:S-adenosyl-L-methionine-dependent methyltransferase [Ascodesmis nigricans]
MAAARKYSKSIQNLIQNVGKMRGKTFRPTVVSPKLCTEIVNHVNLDGYENTTVIDMNPGAGVFSEALYNRLKPKRHVLLEHDVAYHPVLEEMTSRCPNASLVKLNGHDWETYKTIMTGPFRKPTFPEGYTGFEPKTVPLEEGLNRDLLFLGNITNRYQSTRLVNQFMEACGGSRSWIQQYGRVRFLLWMFDSEKERVFPHQMQSRQRTSILGDTYCEIHEVAGTGSVRRGKGFTISVVDRISAEGKKSFEYRMDKLNDNIVKYDLKRAELMEELKSKRDDVKDARSVKLLKARIQKLDVSQLKNYHTRLSLVQATITPKYKLLYGVDIPSLGLEECGQLFNEIKSNPPEEFTTYVEKRFADEAHDERQAKLNERSGSFTPTAEQAAIFAEYEQTHLQFHQLTRIARSIPDEKYARGLNPPLLQAWRDEKNDYPKPVIIGKSDVYPENQLALMDFQPILPPEYLRPEDSSLALARYEMYDWMVRTLFSTRAQSVKSALTVLAPGAACLLEELGPEGEEIGKKRVRVLTTDELVKLAWAWEQWDFKPEELKWGEVSRLEEQKQSPGLIFL